MSTTTLCGIALFAAISLCALAGCSTSVARGPVATSPLVAFAVPAPQAREAQPRVRFDDVYFQRACLFSHTVGRGTKRGR
jgi:hypothetical protein